MIDDIRENLIRMSKQDKLAHAFLFSGSDRTAHETVIRSLLKFDVCESSSRPCETCMPCKKVDHGQHPDFLKIRAEKSEITVKQVHEFTHWVRMQPHESPRKYAWIEDAENLNASSSNALLKTLEEPPPFSVLFLSVDRPDQTLITIRSRLMLVRFSSTGFSSTMDPANEPVWIKDLEAILRSPTKPRFSDLQDLSETIGKTRDDLVWFLHSTQSILLERMRGDPLESLGRIEKLFNRSLEIERQAYQRYGNASLHLDRFFSEWFYA